MSTQLSTPNVALEAVFNALNLGIVVLDHQQTVLRWNTWMEKHSGKSASVAQGMSITEVFAELPSRAFLNAIGNVLDYGLPFVMSSALHRSPLALYASIDSPEEKTRLHQSITITPIHDENGQRCCLIQITDSSTSIKREKILRTHTEVLKKEATTDALTGVYNRRFFDEHFKVTLGHAMRQRVPLSVFMVDIDYFKQYNDFYGHVAGDKTLIQVASILRKQLLRATDVLARYGGEEFILLLPNMGETDAGNFAEKIRLAIWNQALPHKRSPLQQQVSISVGYSHFQNDMNLDPANLLKTADYALYEAKRSGRNQACYKALQEQVPEL